MVESRAFNYEFISLKVCIDMIQGLGYKLRIFGIPIRDEVPAHVFCDNELVVKNCSMESKMNKKNNEVAYHYF